VQDYRSGFLSSRRAACGLENHIYENERHYPFDASCW